MNVHVSALAKGHSRDQKDTAFARDVIDGLTRQPKQLAPKYFYDETGSELFEQITLLRSTIRPAPNSASCATAAPTSRPSFRKVLRWSNSALAPPPRFACCSASAHSMPTCRSS